jgi:hypothetical protein
MAKLRSQEVLSKIRNIKLKKEAMIGLARRLRIGKGRRREIYEEALLGIGAWRARQGFRVWRRICTRRCRPQ